MAQRFILKSLPDSGVLYLRRTAAVHLTRLPQTAIADVEGGKKTSRGMRSRETKKEKATGGLS